MGGCDTYQTAVILNFHVYMQVIFENKIIYDLIFLCCLGFYSGSQYDDPALRQKFPGEGRVDDSVVVIKTHWPLYENSPNAINYERIILVFRNPEDAIRSSYIFHKSGENHSGQLDPQTDTSGSDYVHILEVLQLEYDFIWADWAPFH